MAEEGAGIRGEGEQHVLSLSSTSPSFSGFSSVVIVEAASTTQVVWAGLFVGMTSVSQLHWLTILHAWWRSYRWLLEFLEGPNLWCIWVIPFLHLGWLLLCFTKYRFKEIKVLHDTLPINIIFVVSLGTTLVSSMGTSLFVSGVPSPVFNRFFNVVSLLIADVHDVYLFPFFGVSETFWILSTLVIQRLIAGLGEREIW